MFYIKIEIIIFLIFFIQYFYIENIQKHEHSDHIILILFFLQCRPFLDLSPVQSNKPVLYDSIELPPLQIKLNAIVMFKMLSNCQYVRVFL